MPNLCPRADAVRAAEAVAGADHRDKAAGTVATAVVVAEAEIATGPLVEVAAVADRARPVDARLRVHADLSRFSYPV